MENSRLPGDTAA